MSGPFPALTFDELEQLTGGRLGIFDIACPLCGPARRSPVNQCRRVLRIWRSSPGFASYRCARCEQQGYARDRHGPRPAPKQLAQARTEAAEREREHTRDRLRLVRRLWGRRRPAIDSPVETYLREVRGITGALPATIAFLPGYKHPPAMIAAFALTTEPAPGTLAIEAVRGVHLTQLKPDGSGKAGSAADKITIGHCKGTPIVLAPANDLLGLAITEGIEDGLTISEATGLGVYVAGSAGRLPALADAVPGYVEAVTIYAHDDAVGQRHARELAAALRMRGIEVVVEGLT